LGVCPPGAHGHLTSPSHSKDPGRHSLLAGQQTISLTPSRWVHGEKKRDKIAPRRTGLLRSKFRGIAFSSREFSSPAPRLPLALAQPPRTRLCTPTTQIHSLYSDIPVEHASNRYFSEFVFNPATSCYGCRRVASVVIPDT